MWHQAEHPSSLDASSALSTTSTKSRMYYLGPVIKRCEQGKWHGIESRQRTSNLGHTVIWAALERHCLSSIFILQYLNTRSRERNHGLTALSTRLYGRCSIWSKLLNIASSHTITAALLWPRVNVGSPHPILRLVVSRWLISQ